MDSKKDPQDSMNRRRAIARRVLASGLVLVAASGCHKSASEASDDAGMTAAAQASATGGDAGVPVDTASALADVPPVPPLIPADPAIPIHEALVGSAPIAADTAVPVNTMAGGATAAPANTTAPADAAIPADTTAPTAPPAPPAEQPPPQPEADDTWIPGYWWWSTPLGRYVWVSGTWRHAPPGLTWTAGTWAPDGGQYTWVPGFWGPPGAAPITVAAPPPLLQVEVAGSPPGVGVVWTPGFYAFRDSAYVWTAGSWARPPGAGLAWVEPRYVGPRGHLRFEPGRWDFAPDRRGVAYRPDIDVRSGGRVSFTAVPHGVMLAHERYNRAACHAVAMGATRTPGGGFAFARGVERGPHGGGPGEELHGGPGHREPEGRPEVHGPEGRPENHPGPEGRPENHPGPEARPESHPGPSPQHGGPPGGGHERGPSPGPGPSPGHGGGKRR
jgi:hypothetical protein